MVLVKTGRLQKNVLKNVLKIGKLVSCQYDYVVMTMCRLIRTDYDISTSTFWSRVTLALDAVIWVSPHDLDNAIGPAHLTAFATFWHFSYWKISIKNKPENLCFGLQNVLWHAQNKNLQFVTSRNIWASFSGDPHGIWHQRRPFSEAKLWLFEHMRGMTK